MLMLLWRDVTWPLSASTLSREGGAVAGTGCDRPCASDVPASIMGELSEDAYDAWRWPPLRIETQRITRERGRSLSGDGWLEDGYSPTGVVTWLEPTGEGKGEVTRLGWHGGTCRPVSVLLFFDGPGAAPLFHIGHGSNGFPGFAPRSFADLFRGSSWRDERRPLPFSRTDP